MKLSGYCTGILLGVLKKKKSQSKENQCSRQHLERKHARCKYETLWR